MRWIYFIVLQLTIVLVISGIVYKHKDNVKIVKTPPEVLAKWYKPENKRHVWLHNMFKLRREMQAVQFYAKEHDQEHLAKWALALNKHYLKIGEMVPQWQNKLEVEVLEGLQTSVVNRDYKGVLAKVDALQNSCDSCHYDYRVITAMTYRAPDFLTIKISPQVPFNNHMKVLNKQVNQIKIASEDSMPELALSSFTNLKRDMNKLGQVCNDCHKKDKKAYPNEEMNSSLISLGNSLKTGTQREQAMALGTLAVQACARCHGTHRLAFDTKTLLSKEQSLAELLKH